MAIDLPLVWFGWTAALCVPLPAPAQDPKPRPLIPGRVLVYTVSAGYEHEVVHRKTPDERSLVERALVDLGKRTGHFEAVVTRDSRDFTRARLAEIDLVFFYTTGELPLSKDEREALFAFVREGGAFAGAHCATDTFHEVPEYGAMIGAYFDGHPWHEEVRVKVEDRDHPATRHLGDAFAIADEIYQMKAPYDRRKLHVLLSLDTASLDHSGETVHRKDGDFAIAWTKEHGQGRVFYTALGHRPEVWTDERFLRHLDGGFRWAMRQPEEAPRPGKPARPSGGEEKKDGSPDEDPPGPALPLVPDGFAVDLIAEAPQILWPSAVACLPDGSLLVGEDRMDMPGPTDQPVDRIVRLRWTPEGSFETTVFAEKLFAVMGLAEVDGDVFVINMPRLTRLRDADGDGVAEEREEILTDLGPPAPGTPGGFNDHIVSGMRLGMDGYLYVAVGDKGIPGAHGKDGRTIQLRGGGVVRVRPDGTGLEVVATGLRNVLDVAIDERGEMFTYDNTDDGLGWWTRLTHVVASGYYGYPWDYREHPERMLPCMAEYGGGSPCGGLVYREAAWPEEYRGSLFFCEWGKSALRRFVLERNGATFEVAKAEDFVRGGDVKSFKPFDVCESPDGRFLYVSDWAYEGWTNPKEAGRLWRIRRADDDPRVQSVAPPLSDDVDALVLALGDPSFQVRLRAQRKLAQRGPTIVARLLKQIESSRDERTLRHALWAIASVDRRKLEQVARVADALREVPDFRLQLVRAVGMDERPMDVDVLDWIQDGDLPTRREAAAAIALSYRDGRAGLRRYREGSERDGKRFRIGGGVFHLAGQRAQSLAWLLPGNQDPFVAFAIRQALRELPIRLTPFGSRSGPEVVAACLPAVRDVFTTDAVDGLLRVFESDLPTSLRAEALTLLGGLHRQPQAWDGKWWSIQPAKTPPPPKVIEWTETWRILETVRFALHDPEPEVREAALSAIRDMPDRQSARSVRERWSLEDDPELRMLILDVLGALKDEGADDLLDSVVRDLATDESLRKRAIDAACAIRTESMLDLLASIVLDRGAPPDLVLPCLHALGRLREPRTGDAVAGRLDDADEGVRLAAISALVDVRGEAAAADLFTVLGDRSAEVRRACLRALARLRLADGVPRILPLVRDEATRNEAILALAELPDARALDAYLLGIQASQRNKGVRDASFQALAAIREEIRGALESLHAAGKIDETQLAEIQTLYREPQPITRWRLLGPFERKEEPDLAAGELREIDLARRFVGRGGQEVGWIERLAEPKDGFVDLAKRLSRDANVSAYALAEVLSPTDCEVDMTVGSDDGVVVWVNGEQVHEFPDDRAWTADQDRFRVHLAASSANRILVRVVNNAGGWSFNAKIAGDPTGPLFARPVSLPGLEDYRSFSLEHRGDPARGFRIFRESRDEAMCVRCHAVFGVGEKVGPDLSDIGARYSREELLASILEPSLRIAEGYTSVSIELQDGRTLFGMVHKETADAIDLYDTSGELQKVEKADVASRSALATSVMPDGLWTTMSKEDLVDLLEWLTTLRGAPEGRQGGR